MPLLGEDKIDIWGNKKNYYKQEKVLDNDKDESLNLKSSQTIKALDEVQIQEGTSSK